MRTTDDAPRKSARRTRLPDSSSRSKSGARDPVSSIRPSGKIQPAPTERSPTTSLAYRENPLHFTEACAYNASDFRENDSEEHYMAYIITETGKGTKARSCVDFCPVDCIHDEGDDDPILYIDPDDGIDC